MKDIESRVDGLETVVIWDQDCGFCAAFVEWLGRGLREKVRFIPRTLFVSEDDARDSARTIIVRSGARRMVEGQAITFLLARRSGYAWLSVLLGATAVNRWLSNLGYRFVAARRAAISARLGLVSCSVTPRTAPPGAEPATVALSPDLAAAGR